MVNTRSASAAASAGEFAHVAPWARSFSAFDLVRL